MHGTSIRPVGVTHLRTATTSLRFSRSISLAESGPSSSDRKAGRVTGLAPQDPSHGYEAVWAEFRARFPEVPVECGSVENSPFFGQTFDGVVAWGLLFLLRSADQVDLIRRTSAVLKPGGRLLFTAPKQKCTWQDILTGRESVSLGSEEYRRLLEAEHLEEIGEAEDEGENHYYLARKPTSGSDLPDI